MESIKLKAFEQDCDELSITIGAFTDAIRDLHALTASARDRIEQDRKTDAERIARLQRVADDVNAPSVVRQTAQKGIEPLLAVRYCVTAPERDAAQSALADAKAAFDETSKLIQRIKQDKDTLIRTVNDQYKALLTQWGEPVLREREIKTAEEAFNALSTDD